MNLLEGLAVVAAGMGAGGVNAIVGSGSLITFPTLLAIGIPPVTANVSNNIGLVPGSVSGVVGYRRELEGQRRRSLTLAAGSVAGSLVGSILLLRLDSEVFEAVVPILVLLACALMLAQPPLSAWVASRKAEGARDVGVVPVAITFFAGIYGGYFGAAQGVILLAALAVFVPDDLQRSNAVKNVLAMTVNSVAAIVFFVSYTQLADDAEWTIDWLVVVLIALGSTVGATLGARYGRRIPAPVLRYVVVVVGVAVAIKLLWARYG